MSLKFQEWVKDYGGIEKLAVELDVTSFAVRRWMKQLSWPKIENIQKMVKLSKGRLTLEGIVKDTTPVKKKKS